MPGKDDVARYREKAEELVLIYQSKGLPKDQAKQLTKHVMASEKTALDTLVREELGIDPDDLGGSPWTAAGSSFLLFAVGAIVPVVPFFFMTGMSAVAVSVLVSAAGLFVLGAGVSLLTGRGLVFTGLRQMLLGLVAAGVTYGVGSLLGVTMT